MTKKLEFYEQNDLDVFTIDPQKGKKVFKSGSELKEEIEEQIYRITADKEISSYIKKRFIDNFLVGRDGGYRTRMGY